MALHLAQEPAADELLAEDPMALLVGMLLDQQVPLEWAFGAPYRLAQRLGVARLDAAVIADYDPDELIAVFTGPPALHRFPKAMAERTQKLAQMLVEEYDGDAAAVWRDASSGAELLKRVGRLPGFGKQKAQIFVALLGKQLGVQPRGWRQAAGEFGVKGSFKSVADIVDEASLVRVRQYKKDLKAAAKANG
jgi:uncharacterized HhH-GPD family protein